jgi:chromosome segregation ATPase
MYFACWKISGLSPSGEKRMSNSQATHNGASHHSVGDANGELLKVDDLLQKEMQRLAQINQQLLGKVGPDSKESLEFSDESDELTHLRQENAELRARVEELEQAIQAEPPVEKEWAEQQKEYEALLEEKSEVIRTLHLKMQELQECGSPQGSSNVSNAEVERLKQEMAEQRRQLEEDEESLMQQMRQMEMAMSKDRAELSRQRNEVQRLHNELNHEIELASRDPGLRERLVALQRLQGEIVGRKASVALNAGKPSADPNLPPPVPEKKENHGLMRRIFGK